jgi:hypothetical protein
MIPFPHIMGGGGATAPSRRAGRPFSGSKAMPTSVRLDQRSFVATLFAIGFARIA